MELGYILRYTHFQLRTDHKNLLYINNNNSSQIKGIEMEVSYSGI
jgi:hypothetical protein